MTVSRWVVARKSSRVDQEIQTREACQGALAKPKVRLGAVMQDPEWAGVEDISSVVLSLLWMFRMRSSPLKVMSESRDKPSERRRVF